MLNKIITVYAITDDLLKAIEHHEDCRRGMSNAEIMTTALIAAIFFNSNHSKDYRCMKDHNLILDNLHSKYGHKWYPDKMLLPQKFTDQLNL